MQINLTANNATEARILAYLHENASEPLAEKISAGKKTLAGSVGYAKEEARKLAVDGCACVDDATVFGWIVHYFEEDSIEEKAKPKPAVTLPGGVKQAAPAPTQHQRVKDRRARIAARKAKDDTPTAVAPPKPTPPAGPQQLTMFEALFTGAKA